MHLAVIGASGKLGRAIVTEALRRGHAVTGLVRSRDKAADLADKITVVEGDGRDETALTTALTGADAVIVPAGGRVDPVTAEIVKAVMPVMDRLGIGRIVVASAYGAVDGRGAYGWLLRTMAKAVAKDKTETEAALRASSLEWTAVRPGGLTDGPATGKAKAADQAVLSGFPRISRADVAGFIIDEVEQPRFVRQSPVVHV